MRVACVVQARVGSSRLPGKVLRTVGDQTILNHVLARAKAIPGVDVVHVTTTPDPADDAVANRCRGAGVGWSRGQVPTGRGRNDVLTGYVVAAQATEADVLVRLTSDCPLLDPAVAGEVLRRFLETSGSGYASNVEPPSWFDGTDVEVFSRAALEFSHREAGPGEREHVTTWMRRNFPNVAASYRAPQDWSWLKLSVDVEADLVRVRKTWACLRNRASFGWRDVVRAYRRAYPPRIFRLGAALYSEGERRSARIEAFARGAARLQIRAGADAAEAAAWSLGSREPALPPHEQERVEQFLAVEDAV